MSCRAWSQRLCVIACALGVMSVVASSAENEPDQASPLKVLARSLPSPLAVEELKSALPNARAPDVVEALLAIRGNPCDDARPAVTACLKRPEPMVVQTALSILPLLAPEPDDIAQARTLLEAKDPVIRNAAIKFAADCHDNQAIPAIARCLNDPATLEEAHNALVKISGRDVGRTEQPWADWFTEHEEQIKQALSVYADRLRSSDDAIVIASINQLLQLDAAADAKAGLISPLINSSNPDVASTASMAVNKVDPNADVPVPEIIRKPIEPVARAAPAAAANNSSAWMRSTSFVALGAVAFGFALIGALILMVFLLRTKEVLVEATRRLTRRIGKGTARVGKGAKHWTEKVIKAIKKKITFIK